MQEIVITYITITMQQSLQGLGQALAISDPSVTITIVTIIGHVPILGHFIHRLQIQQLK